MLKLKVSYLVVKEQNYGKSENLRWLRSGKSRSDYSNVEKNYFKYLSVFDIYPLLFFIVHSTDS